MSLAEEGEEWSGMLDRFPTVLHARASFLFDINTDSLQRAIISALGALEKTARPMKISMSDRSGDFDGNVSFRVGVADGTGFYRLDRSGMRRVFRRIEENGPFQTFDIAINLHYSVESTGRHSIHGDRYIARMIFQPGRLELLLHHFKGLKRIQPDELVHFLLTLFNGELARRKYPELEPET